MCSGSFCQNINRFDQAETATESRLITIPIRRVWLVAAVCECKLAGGSGRVIRKDLVLADGRVATNGPQLIDGIADYVVKQRGIA